MRSSISLPFHAKHLFGLAWVVVYVFLFLLAVGAFITDCGVDSCIFIYVAQGILEGEIPYLDRWDHKGPLLYLLNLVGLLMHDLWGLWIVQGFFLLGASLFAFLTLRRGFGTAPALFSLAIFLIFFSKFARPGDFTEQYGLLFQFLTLYLFLRSREQSCLAPFQARFASLHLAIGFLGAASFLLRPNLVALWIVIGLYWLLLRDASLRKVAWAVVGGAGILALVAVFFMIVGAWGALWDAVFLFNLAYSDASSSGQTRGRAVAGYTDVPFLFAHRCRMVYWPLLARSEKSATRKSPRPSSYCRDLASP